MIEASSSLLFTIFVVKDTCTISWLLCTDAQAVGLSNICSVVLAKLA